MGVARRNDDDDNNNRRGSAGPIYIPTEYSRAEWLKKDGPARMFGGGRKVRGEGDEKLFLGHFSGVEWDIGRRPSRQNIYTGGGI